ncbi:MAG TPA: type III pantothenate kinase [Alphaproteobacteria bacterium]|nr:type III pantothenate kinase [Alphaproteobacteria bacterium]
MLLAIDAGNTNIVFALFDGEKIKASWRLATQAARTADEYAVFLRALMAGSGIDPRAVKAAIIASVVPEADAHLAALCRDHFRCEPLIVGVPGCDAGIKILLDRPGEIGADRIVNAVAGAASHKPPLLIVDFGTATTFDVVDAEGNYAGGVIAPGINLSLEALHMAAAKLPRIVIVPTARVIGKNTEEAIQSGIYWGYAGLIEGMIARIKKEFGKPMTVIATGGLARLFADAVDGIDRFDADLTLRGLYRIYERNIGSSSRKVAG